MPCALRAANTAQHQYAYRARGRIAPNGYSGKDVFLCVMQYLHILTFIQNL